MPATKTPRRTNKTPRRRTASIEDDAAGAQRLLSILGYPHLRARLLRGTVLVESGPADDPHIHFRLSPLSHGAWRLDVPSASGRWQRTPVYGPRGNVIAELHQDFFWLLAPVDFPVPTSA